MKDQAQIVIVGGGIYGVNIAYHLAKLGRKDIVLLRRVRLPAESLRTRPDS